MSDTNSYFGEHSEHSFFGENRSEYSDSNKPKDITKNSSNASKNALIK